MHVSELHEQKNTHTITHKRYIYAPVLGHQDVEEKCDKKLAEVCAETQPDASSKWHVIPQQ